ncbi:MAG: hypothetical protein E6G66_12190 [Actinobacteria bacterium]|nr:MAG: hypothetical protein E6G66_12190 [Actinomycetota bacterium]
MIVAGCAIGLLEQPNSALAQAGYYVTPSLSISEAYDDNVFFTSSNRQDDFISRFMPGLKAGYQSEPFTLTGNYSFRSAIYAEHPLLDSPLESQSGSLGLVYRPTEVLTLGFDGAYSRTSIPSELNQPNAAFPFIPVQATTGILTTRVNSTFYSFMPSIGYSFDALTRGKGTYSYGVFEGGGLTTTTQDVTLGLDHDVTPRDTGTLKSYYRHFGTTASGPFASSAPASSLDSYAVTAGWKHRFTERWDASVEAGPRLTEGAGASGTVDVETNATITWHFATGTATLGYARTQLSAAGVGGALSSDSVFATLLVEPIRSLRLSLSPRWVQNTTEGGGASTTGTFTIYTVDATATYQLTRWLSARLNYFYASEQIGKLNIPHNLVTIGLDFVYPERVY